MKVRTKELKFGHELKGGGINDRVNGRDAEIAELAAMISQEGLLQPLCIWKPPSEGGFYVVAGNRRLAALRLLEKSGEAKFADAECIEVQAKTATEALALAMSSNMYLPPHIVDQYFTFNRLSEGGMDEAKICARYSLKKREYRQIMALGGLARVVLDAWREDKIDRDAAEAFTLEPDQKRQAEIFASLKRRGGLYKHGIREAILGRSQESAGLLQFIGKEAYVAAGGALIEDLFSEKEIESEPTDLKLLKKLAGDKLKTEMNKLQGEGWKWVKEDKELPSNGYYYQRHEKKGGGALNTDDKAKLGAIWGFDHQGKFFVKRAMEPPASARAEKRKKGKAAGKAPDLSAALYQRLNEALTKSVATALAADSQTVVLAAVIAGIESGGDVISLKCESRSYLDGSGAIKRDKPADFHVVFSAWLKKTTSALIGRLAEIAGTAVDLHGAHDALAEDKGAAALTARLSTPVLNKELRANFDPKDYFASVPKDLCLAAIAEAVNAQTAKSAAGKKKSEIEKLAAGNVPAKGWLPPALRTANYDGPGKAAKKKAKRK